MSNHNPQDALRRLQGLQRAGIQYLMGREFCRPEELQKPSTLVSPQGRIAGERARTTVPMSSLPKLPEVPQLRPVLPTEPTIPPKIELKRIQSSALPGDPAEVLALLDREVKGCTACDVLVKNRTQTVFGSGNPRARLVFMGEAPGADEDRIGVPFVGRAGQLLERILDACGLKRDDVYILNALKCRPPNNRTPEPTEVEACRGFFEEQLNVIQPEFICCLGLVAATALLQNKTSLSAMRGRLHPWRSSKVVVTYHPAYLLRNPAAKKMTWEDLQFLMREMGFEIPNSSVE